MSLCECGNDDLNSFTFDSDNHSTVCMLCGLVQENSTNYTFTDVLQFIERHGGYKGTYQRKVHLTERFREHNREEPQIPEVDLEKIYRQHGYLCSTNFFYKLLAERGCFGKKEIQLLLRSLDQKENTKKFSRLYLGKYKPCHMKNLKKMDTLTNIIPFI